MEENRPDENRISEEDEAWLNRVYAAVQDDEEKLARVQWTDMAGQPLEEPEKRGEYILYSHVCIPNGKTYVGITRQTPEQRWRNGSAYRSNPEFYADIEKYGWENFIHRIEYSGMTKEEAEIAESVFIGIAASTEPELGYNRSEFGTSAWEPTPEQRKQLAEKKKNYIAAHPEYLEKLHDARRGVPQSKETREKISAARKGQAMPEEQRRKLSRPVRCIETGECYLNAREAAEETGVNASSIGNCCRGAKGHKTAGGMHWEYISG